MSKRSIVAPAVLAVLAASSSGANADRLSKPVIGPQLVCFKYSTFQLKAKERLTDFSGVGEDMTVLIKGPKGNIRIAEGEVWADTEKAKQLVLKRGRTTIFRIVGEPRYAIYGPLGSGQDKLLIWLSGSALNGTDKDNEIVSRLNVGDPSEAHCKRQFTYSW